MGNSAAQPAVESAKINRRFVFIRSCFGYTGTMKGGARYGSNQNRKIHSVMQKGSNCPMSPVIRTAGGENRSRDHYSTPPIMPMETLAVHSESLYAGQSRGTCGSTACSPASSCCTTKSQHTTEISFILVVYIEIGMIYNVDNWC